MSNDRHSCCFVLLATIAATLAARLVIAVNFNLFQDEALYAYIAVHDPFSFCPHPPGTGLAVRLGTAIAGHRELGVRLVSIVLSSLTLVAIFLTAKELLGRRVAAGSVLLAAAAPMYLAFGAICTPDSSQLFFWSVLVFCTAKALDVRESGVDSTGNAEQACRSSRGWWLLAGVCLGVGLYVKYMLILYVPSLLLCLLLHGPWRRLLRTPGPWLALAVGFALFVPVAVWWDYTKDWQTLRYHLVERQSFRLDPSYLFVYLGAHFLFYSPLVYVGALAGMAYAGWRGIRGKNGPLIFLFSMSVVAWLFFAMIASVTRRGLSREQWDAIAYVTAMIAAAALYRDRLRRWAGSWKSVILRATGVVAVCLGMLVSLGIIVEGVTGSLSGLLGTHTPFTALYGWREMASAADRQIASFRDPKNAFFLGQSFVPSLQYAFYGSATGHVYAMKSKRNERYGVDAQLVHWGMTPEFLARETGRDALFVISERAKNSHSEREKDGESVKQLEAMFEQVSGLDTVESRLGSQVVRRFRMFRCVGLRPIDEWGEGAHDME